MCCAADAQGLFCFVIFLMRKYSVYLGTFVSVNPEYRVPRLQPHECALPYHQKTIRTKELPSIVLWCAQSWSCPAYSMDHPVDVK